MENLEQALIELIADYLDSDTHKMNEACAGLYDPEPPERTELHIRMAQAAYKEYMNTAKPEQPTMDIATQCGASWQVIDIPNEAFTLKCRTCGVMVGAGGPPRCKRYDPEQAATCTHTGS